MLPEESPGGAAAKQVGFPVAPAENSDQAEQEFVDEAAAGIDPRDLARAEEARGAQRRRFVARMFQALDEKMKQIEERIARSETEPQSAADAERDARSLSSLAGLYAKLVELDEAAVKQGAGKGKEREAAKDADQFREDIARRIRRLHQAGHA